MAYTIGDKTYRNLQEQVLQNARDINDIKTVNTLLNQFGIKVVGECDTALDLPDPSTYSGNYGDAYAVGTETPYDLYIFTRPFDGEEYPHWFNIGPFPLEGPEGPQGETGAQGEKGNTGGAFLTGEGNPPTSIGTQDGQGYLDATTGNIYQYSTNPASWTRVGNIRGPQGIQGQQGPQGATGPQGPQGPQGPAGKVVNIVGNLASIENLPTPSTIDFHDAYLVGANAPYHLYIIEGTESDSTTWSWFDAGAFTSGGEYTRVTDDNDSYVANLKATTTPESGAVARYDSDGQLQCEAPTVDKDVANKKYVDDNKGAKVLVLTESTYNRNAQIIEPLANSVASLDYTKVPNYIMFTYSTAYKGVYSQAPNPLNVGAGNPTSSSTGGGFALVSIDNNGIAYFYKFENERYVTANIRGTNIRCMTRKYACFQLNLLTGLLDYGYVGSDLVNFDAHQLLQQTLSNVSWTNVIVNISTGTASLTTDGYKWPELTNVTKEIHRVSISFSGGNTIYLNRVAMNTNSTVKTCDYACIVDRTIYWAHFELNAGVYSGLLKVIDPVEGNVADTPSAVLTTLKTQDGTVYGINNAKKYNVIKIDIPQCSDHTDLALFYLVGTNNMDTIYKSLSLVTGGTTVNASVFDSVLVYLINNVGTVSSLANLFGSLAQLSEKIYYTYYEGDLDKLIISRLTGTNWYYSGSDLECNIYNSSTDENINPTPSGHTITDWQTITVTLEDYQADNSDEIYNKENV